MEGKAMGLVGSGILGPGQAEYFDVLLQSGVTYRVYVKPVDPTVDFDLYIRDERGNLVAWDATPAADAFCDVTPLWTGPFRLTVMAKRGLSVYNIAVMN
jgi:hypothetical protein